MPEIGPTLRETRMRQGLEISDIEASTKIRAKYLRAIENEEWDLLPGPTFVKSFLRTYAEALDLDSRLLLEEYKSRYERFDEHDARPSTTSRGTSHSSSGRERRPPPRRAHPGRWILLACAAMVVVIVFFLLGSGDDTPDRKGVTSAVTETTAKTTQTTAKAKTTAAEKPRTTAEKDAKPAAGKTVKLRIVPTGEVYACLFAGSKRLIAGQTLTEGTPSDSYKSKRFVVVLGNGNATLDVDGKTLKVPQSDQPIGYEVTSAGRTRIAAGELPTC